MTVQKSYKSYQKCCRYCLNGPTIIWDDLHKYFTNQDGSRHSCPNSSTGNKQLAQDKKLNETINDLRYELDSKFDALRQDISSQQTATQKAIASLRAEINQIHTLFKNHTGGYS